MTSVLRRWYIMTMRVRYLHVAAALALASCAEHRDWAFIQSVGGMTLGTPYRTDRGVMLPVAVDVSGLRRITTEPRIVNSGMAIKEITAQHEHNEIEIRLVTTAAGGADLRASTDEVPLGALAPGRYAVVYVEPSGSRVPLGQVAVP